MHCSCLLPIFLLELVFVKWAIPGPFSPYSSPFQQSTVNMFCIKFSQWLNSNRGPLAHNSTALPTEPQPKPNCHCSCFPSKCLINPTFRSLYCQRDDMKNECLRKLNQIELDWIDFRRNDAADVEWSIFWKTKIIKNSQVFFKKKHRWCAWDSNPGPQDGRRRRNHVAVAAAHEE